jgi:ribosomal protein S18 acetylase RimI-like enzyme
MPDGLEVRPVPEAQLRQLWDADVEAFRDHWGGFDDSPERYASWRGDPKFDPSLWVIAWDGDEIAGGVINEISATENAAFNRQRGWLASVFVRRPWRRRGLARALVGRSLTVLRDRGMTSAGLGVDAENPTGALGLYESAGFEVEYRSNAYRKPM